MSYLCYHSLLTEMGRPAVPLTKRIVSGLPGPPQFPSSRTHLPAPKGGICKEEPKSFEEPRGIREGGQSSKRTPLAPLRVLTCRLVRRGGFQICYDDSFPTNTQDDGYNSPGGLPPGPRQEPRPLVNQPVPPSAEPGAEPVPPAQGAEKNAAHAGQKDASLPLRRLRVWGLIDNRRNVHCQAGCVSAKDHCLGLGDYCDVKVAVPLG